MIRKKLVYFIQEGEGGLIKIGCTYKIYSRLADIQKRCASRLRLLGVIDGYYDEESELHAKFSSLNVHGEWFNPGKALIDYINLNTSIPPRTRSVKEGRMCQGRTKYGGLCSTYASKGDVYCKHHRP